MKINNISSSQNINFKAILSDETAQYIATRSKETPLRSQKAYNKEYRAFVQETISQIKAINPQKYCIVKITQGNDGDYFNLYSYETKEDMRTNNWKSQFVVSGSINDGRSLLEVLLELKKGLFEVSTRFDKERVARMSKLCTPTLRQSRQCPDGTCSTCD